MDALTITPLYAAICGLILLALTLRVVVQVRAKGVNYGDDGNPEYTAIVRGHGNFIEYVPIALILIAFVEAGGASDTWVHGLGCALVIARIVHPFGLKAIASERPPTLRLIGNVSTWLVLLIASVLLLMNQLG